MQVVALVGDHQQKLKLKVEEVEDGLAHGTHIEALIHSSQKGDEDVERSRPTSIIVKPDAPINLQLGDQMERVDQDEHEDNNLLAINTSDAVMVQSSRARSSHATSGHGLKGPNGSKAQSTSKGNRGQINKNMQKMNDKSCDTLAGPLEQTNQEEVSEQINLSNTREISNKREREPLQQPTEEDYPKKKFFRPVPTDLNTTAVQLQIQSKHQEFRSSFSRQGRGGAGGFRGESREKADVRASYKAPKLVANEHVIETGQNQISGLTSHQNKDNGANFDFNHYLSSKRGRTTQEQRRRKDVLKGAQNDPNKRKSKKSMLNTDLWELENQYPKEMPKVDTKVITRRGSQAANEREIKETDLSGEAEVPQPETAPKDTNPEEMELRESSTNAERIRERTKFMIQRGQVSEVIQPKGDDKVQQNYQLEQSLKKSLQVRKIVESSGPVSQAEATTQVNNPPNTEMGRLSKVGGFSFGGVGRANSGLGGGGLFASFSGPKDLPQKMTDIAFIGSETLPGHGVVGQSSIDQKGGAKSTRRVFDITSKPSPNDNQRVGITHPVTFRQKQQITTDATLPVIKQATTPQYIQTQRGDQDKNASSLQEQEEQFEDKGKFTSNVQYSIESIKLKGIEGENNNKKEAVRQVIDGNDQINFILLSSPIEHDQRNTDNSVRKNSQTFRGSSGFENTVSDKQPSGTADGLRGHVVRGSKFSRHGDSVHLSSRSGVLSAQQSQIISELEMMTYNLNPKLNGQVNLTSQRSKPPTNDISMADLVNIAESKRNSDEATHRVNDQYASRRESDNASRTASRLKNISMLKQINNIQHMEVVVAEQYVGQFSRTEQEFKNIHVQNNQFVDVSQGRSRSKPHSNDGQREFGSPERHHAQSGVHHQSSTHKHSRENSPSSPQKQQKETKYIGGRAVGNLMKGVVKNSIVVIDSQSSRRSQNGIGNLCISSRQLSGQNKHQIATFPAGAAHAHTMHNSGIASSQGLIDNNGFAIVASGSRATEEKILINANDYQESSLTPRLHQISETNQALSMPDKETSQQIQNANIRILSRGHVGSRQNSHESSSKNSRGSKGTLFSKSTKSRQRKKSTHINLNSGTIKSSVVRAQMNMDISISQRSRETDGNQENGPQTIGECSVPSIQMQIAGSNLPEGGEVKTAQPTYLVNQKQKSFKLPLQLPLLESQQAAALAQTQPSKLTERATVSGRDTYGDKKDVQSSSVINTGRGLVVAPKFSDTLGNINSEGVLVNVSQPIEFDQQSRDLQPRIPSLTITKAPIGVVRVQQFSGQAVPQPDSEMKHTELLVKEEPPMQAYQQSPQFDEKQPVITVQQNIYNIISQHSMAFATLNEYEKKNLVKIQEEIIDDLATLLDSGQAADHAKVQKVLSLLQIIRQIIGQSQYSEDQRLLQLAHQSHILPRGATNNQSVVNSPKQRIIIKNAIGKNRVLSTHVPKNQQNITYPKGDKGLVISGESVEVITAEKGLRNSFEVSKQSFENTNDSMFRKSYFCDTIIKKNRHQSLGLNTSFGNVDPQSMFDLRKFQETPLSYGYIENQAMILQKINQLQQNLGQEEIDAKKQLNKIILDSYFIETSQLNSITADASPHTRLNYQSFGTLSNNNNLSGLNLSQNIEKENANIDQNQGVRTNVNQTNMTLYQKSGLTNDEDYKSRQPKIIVPNNGLAFANFNKGDHSLHDENSEILENLKGNSKISNSSLDQGDTMQYLGTNVQMFNQKRQSSNLTNIMQNAAGSKNKVSIDDQFRKTYQMKINEKRSFISQKSVCTPNHIQNADLDEELDNSNPGQQLDARRGTQKIFNTFKRVEKHDVDHLNGQASPDVSVSTMYGNSVSRPRQQRNAINPFSEARGQNDSSHLSQPSPFFINNRPPNLDVLIAQDNMDDPALQTFKKETSECAASPMIGIMQHDPTLGYSPKTSIKLNSGGGINLQLHPQITSQISQELQGPQSPKFIHSKTRNSSNNKINGSKQQSQIQINIKNNSIEGGDYFEDVPSNFGTRQQQRRNHGSGNYGQWATQSKLDTLVLNNSEQLSYYGHKQSSIGVGLSPRNFQMSQSKEFSRSRRHRISNSNAQYFKKFMNPKRAQELENHSTGYQTFSQVDAKGSTDFIVGESFHATKYYVNKEQEQNETLKFLEKQMIKESITSNLAENPRIQNKINLLKQQRQKMNGKNNKPKLFTQTMYDSSIGLPSLQSSQKHSKFAVQNPGFPRYSSTFNKRRMNLPDCSLERGKNVYSSNQKVAETSHNRHTKLSLVDDRGSIDNFLRSSYTSQHKNIGNHMPSTSNQSQEGFDNKLRHSAYDSNNSKMGLISKIGNQLKGALNTTGRPGRRLPKPSQQISIIQKWGSPNYSKTSAEFMYPHDMHRNLQMDSARTSGSKTLSMMALKIPSHRDDGTVYNQTYTRVLNQGSKLNMDLVKVDDVKIIEKSQQFNDIQTNYCQSQKSNGNININMKSEESHFNPLNRSTDIRPNLSINHRPNNISISIDNYNSAGDIETKIQNLQKLSQRSMQKQRDKKSDRGNFPKIDEIMNIKNIKQQSS